MNKFHTKEAVNAKPHDILGTTALALENKDFVESLKNDEAKALHSKAVKNILDELTEVLLPDANLATSEDVFSDKFKGKHARVK